MNSEDLAALYFVPPGQFVRRRGELAASAQREGDKAAASEIKKLRKPTVGAWLANLLVHEHPDQIDELLQLGEILRQAQLNLAGPEMRHLSQQRHQVLSALVAEARSLAGKAGQAVSDESTRELETTLSAAVADSGAAEQLRTGQLTSALSYAGFGPLEGFTAPTTPTTRARPADRPTVDDDRDEQRREAAETAFRRAEEAAAAAQRALDQREQATVHLRTERDRLAAEVDELHRRLEDARSAAATTERELAVAERALRDAERAAREAKEQMTQAARVRQQAG